MTPQDAELQGKPQAVVRTARQTESLESQPPITTKSQFFYAGDSSKTDATDQPARNLFRWFDHALFIVVLFYPLGQFFGRGPQVDRCGVAIHARGAGPTRSAFPLMSSNGHDGVRTLQVFVTLFKSNHRTNEREQVVAIQPGIGCCRNGSGRRSIPGLTFLLCCFWRNSMFL
jgi:hypothetical protein